MPDTNLQERMPEWSAEINRGTPTGMGRCPARARTKVVIDAPIGTATYARMFPELPSFQADEEFLHSLGRAGGLCDCREKFDLVSQNDRMFGLSKYDGQLQNCLIEMEIKVAIMKI